ncbi:MAG: hypothetical protein WCK73_10125 [Deltaproteobacteria bacterium]
MSSSPAPSRAKRVQQRLTNEMKEYTVVAGYFALLFLAIATYRTVTLAEYDIITYAYGSAIIEAAILGKVVLLGQVLHVGEKHQDRPLFVAILWKALTFSIFAAVLITAEHAVKALVKGHPLSDEFRLSGGRGWEMLSHFQLVTVTFMSFFALRETARAFGCESLFALLFGPRPGGAPRKG